MLFGLAPAHVASRLDLVASLKAEVAGGVWRHRKKDGTIFDAEIISNEISLNDVAARLVISRDVTQQAKEAPSSASSIESAPVSSG